MLPGINPNQMKAMMKQLGMKQEEIEALRVIIEKEDENIIIENPNVMKINMQRQESWQITGDARTEEKAGFSEADIKIVMDKTGVNEHDARKALEKYKGDLSEAILSLTE
ncbi:nascent polypeptide-associated complex protein [Candidatus Pacearchaeota archaeon]|nr:nascent polypeptide-associated complex protein [Candidatus Pacearchaeota archaeon]